MMASSIGTLSTKGGGIRLKPCTSEVRQWSECGDAMSKSWRSDLSQSLLSLNKKDREKLTKTSGFCPHRRCQLDHLGNSNERGECTEGLCYTKVEVCASFIWHLFNVICYF